MKTFILELSDMTVEDAEEMIRKIGVNRTGVQTLEAIKKLNPVLYIEIEARRKSRMGQE